jgi:hypothetical protein
LLTNLLLNLVLSTTGKDTTPAVRWIAASVAVVGILVRTDKATGTMDKGTGTTGKGTGSTTARVTGRTVKATPG